VRGRSGGVVSTVISPNDLKELVIRPTLDSMVPIWGPQVNTEAAVNLLLGTVYQESVVGGVTHLKQIKGPALGIYQMEPDTEADIFENYLNYKPAKLAFIRSLLPGDGYNVFPEQSALVSSLRYATAMARIKYWRRTFDWPTNPNNVLALAKIWDTHYNANPDKGFPHEFVEAYPGG